MTKHYRHPKSFPARSRTPWWPREHGALVRLIVVHEVLADGLDALGKAGQALQVLLLLHGQRFHEPHRTAASGTHAKFYSNLDVE